LSRISGQLTKWDSLRTGIAAIGKDVVANPGLEPWRAARSAAEKARQAMGYSVDDPVSITDVVDRFGGVIAGATLPSAHATAGVAPNASEEL
jgi:hypothetical protein